LAAAGIVYPDRWRAKRGLTHHGLAELLRASLDSDCALDDLMRFLDSQADGDVLFSAEALTYWLMSDQRQEALLKFLSAAREVMPTRCIWTLRRHDEFIGSLFLLSLKRGGKPAPPAEKADTVPQPDQMFAGLRKVEEALDDVVYVKYDPAGQHNGELLRTFGIPVPLAARIGDQLERAPRLNAAPSYKEAVALVNLDALSTRSGVSLDAPPLRRVF